MFERLSGAQVTAIIIVAIICIPITTCMSSDSDDTRYTSCLNAGKSWVNVPLVKDGFGNPTFECK